MITSNQTKHSDKKAKFVGSILIRKLRGNRKLRLNIIVVILLSIIGFIWVYPFLWSIGAAFKPQSELYSAGANIIPQKWVFENFVRAWVKAKFSQYFVNTVLYSVSTTGIILIISSMCGYALSRYRFPGRNLIYFTILATLFIPISTIIIPQFVLVDALGLLNTEIGVILALVGGGGALNVLLFVGFFDTIPDELFDAAKIDGANFLQTFWLVAPLARPIIATVAIFSFMATWNNFQIPLVFTLSRPDLRTLAVGMFSFQGEYTFDWSGFAAATVISFIPILIVFLIFQGYFVRGLAGSIKG